MRKGRVERKTKETEIKVEINLDGRGKGKISTGIGFFDHMLEHLAKHSGCDISVDAKGDLQVDAHHTVEDVGICVGEAIKEALGDKKGIKRFASALVPMDESLVEVSMDISGRPYFVFNADFPTEKIGEFDVQLVGEFFRALTNNADITLHINVRYGNNSHHIAEAIFKSVAQALGEAITIISSDIPSTKGRL